MATTRKKKGVPKWLEDVVNAIIRTVLFKFIDWLIEKGHLSKGITDEFKSTPECIDCFLNDYKKELGNEQ